MTAPIALRLYQREQQEYPLNLYLPELCADQELNVGGVDTESAVRLLKSLMADDDREQTIEIEQMTASDRDRLLARLYQECWGDRILATLNCDYCAEPFDLSFDLSVLMQSLYAEADQWEVIGNARLVDREATGKRDRQLLVPQFSQERIAVNRSMEDALEELRKVLEIDSDELDEVCRQLETAAPIVDVELEASCPECERRHLAHFDIQTYFLQRLINERKQTLSEVHLIAANYGWSLAEIKSLSRSTRQSMALLIIDTA